MTKNELFNKLHETLWEKDRLNETMTQAFRDKVESEKHVISLTNDFGNLQEAFNDLVDSQRNRCFAKED